MLLSPLTALHLAKLAQKDRLTLENSQCKACLSRAGAQWPTVNRRNKGHGLCDTGAGGQDQGLQGCCDAFKAVPRVWNVHKSCRCPGFMVRGATSRILILQYQNGTLYEGSYVNKVQHALQGKEANKTWLYFNQGNHIHQILHPVICYFLLQCYLASNLQQHSPQNFRRPCGHQAYILKS